MTRVGQRAESWAERMAAMRAERMAAMRADWMAESGLLE